MRFGVQMFVTDTSISVTELAREAELRGFASLWLPEHTHIPTSRRTTYPTGDDLPPEYYRAIDPFIGLTAAAMVTDKLRLGTGVALIAQRDPIVTAKMAACLDGISGGRFSLGVGYGWNVEEMNHHRVQFSTRRAQAQEHLLTMRALWERDEASFEGEFVQLEPSNSWPKPVQARLPVLFGGAIGPKLIAAITEVGDGWMPIGGADLAEGVVRLRSAFEEAGRDARSLTVMPFGACVGLEAPPEVLRRLDLGLAAGGYDRLAELGIEECVFLIPTAGRQVVLPILDAQAVAAGLA